MGSIRVHFIGGPAHGEDRVVEDDKSVWRIAEAPRLQEACFVRDARGADLKCNIHEYFIRKVARDTFVGLHSSLVAP